MRNSAQEATVQCDHTTYHNYIAKIRGIVYLNLEIVTQSKGETRWVAIATIPEGFRPKWSFRTPITYNDTVAVGSINSSGAIAIALPFESNVQMQVIGVWNT